MRGFNPKSVSLRSGAHDARGSAAPSLNRRIILRLIDLALTEGYSITADDGETETVRLCRDKDQLAHGLFRSAEEYLLFYDEADTYLGSLTLLYQGDLGVMADSSDNERLNQLADEAARSI